MAQHDRLYKLKHWLDGGRCVTREFLLRELEVSASTLKRDIAKLRDRYNAPIEWDAERGGWLLDRGQPGAGAQYELPGLWFSAEEIHALLTMQHLLAHLDGIRTRTSATRRWPGTPRTRHSSRARSMARIDWRPSVCQP